MKFLKVIIMESEESVSLKDMHDADIVLNRGMIIKNRYGLTSPLHDKKIQNLKTIATRITRWNSLEIK